MTCWRWSPSFRKNPHGVGHFEVQVNRETIEIPNRVYHPALIDVSKLSSLPWVPAYVIQLLGEYVIEIQQLLEARLQHLDKNVYRNFLLQIQHSSLSQNNVSSVIGIATTEPEKETAM
jgi:hypothetical protein